MSDHDSTTQIGTRIDKSLWEQFRQDVQERHGRVRGHLSAELETALREYLNASEGGDTHDRLTDIEAELREVRTLLEQSDEKKKDSGLTTTTENRLQDIRDTIAEEAGDSPKVHEKVVEMAIREHAGGSSPTIRRYKELLREDKVLFPDPSHGSKYFQDATRFAQAVNVMCKDNDISQSVYDDLVDDYGRDWWLAHLPDDDTDDGRRGFQ